MTITLGGLVSDCVVDFSSSIQNLKTDGYVISVEVIETWSVAALADVIDACYQHVQVKCTNRVFSYRQLHNKM